ncbi:ATP-dependent helicase HrpB [Paraoerskovia marina]|uniref:ATP-dependent helicase HrpB n=1 Tax=Paraoerskovia marina TaxID=545619 RepID=UPI000AA76AE4|nr:ATP-dependent helicase HrpB [Paraoerskovia marina]
MDPIDALLADPPPLPVAAALDRVVGRRAEAGSVVVQAPPGTGKTTLIPPALAARYPGRVLVTQPRRIAARAAARRLASLLGEPLGRTVGHTVRGESSTSRTSRVEFVTTGVLLRRLARDPELPGIHTVVLDEVHERHLDGDLALALLSDVRENLRADLGLVAMSATVEAGRTAAALGPGTSVVDVEGTVHPVDTVWCPPRTPATDARGVAPAFCDHVADVVRRAVDETTGDVLVFMPGAREVDRVLRGLGGLGLDVLALHGRLPPGDQDRALTPGARRRVVVSTAVAESSLTVPGVRVVVDGGLSREPRTDHRRGLAGLVTVSASKASGIQRAGRAGREGPGTVYRCWSSTDDAMRAEHPEPEIRTADLTGFVLTLARWGTPRGDGLALLDPMPDAALESALATLRELALLDDADRTTVLGGQVADLPLDPRLGRALLTGADVVGVSRAADVVAALSEDVRVNDGDLPAALRRLRRGGTGSRPWEQQSRRLARAVPGPGSGGAAAPRDPGPRSSMSDDLAVGVVAALAHPRRVARRRDRGDSYLMASGTGAVLPPGSPLTGAPWLAIADVERSPGRTDAMIRSAAPIDEETALEASQGLLHEDDEVTWANGRVEARRVTRLGAIPLGASVVSRPSPERVRDAVAEGLRRDGLDILRWSDAATALRHRLAFLHGALGEPWPDVSDEALIAQVDRWLGADLDGSRGRVDRIDTVQAVRRLLPWPQASRLDELAPERLEVPSGSRVRVDYSGDQPVLAVRLQEAFGWQVTPRLADGRVPVLVHLLSPAGRPAAVTADLGSFWANAYPQVRAELRGRYPKHSWPQDPADGVPSRRVRRPR